MRKQPDFTKVELVKNSESTDLNSWKNEVKTKLGMIIVITNLLLWRK